LNGPDHAVGPLVVAKSHKHLIEHDFVEDRDAVDRAQL
jgi:hypothetical protein